MNNRLKNYLKALPSMGLTFVVLGVLLLAISFLMDVKNNILLFTGLFFIVVGIAGYVYTLKGK